LRPAHPTPLQLGAQQSSLEDKAVNADKQFQGTGWKFPIRTDVLGKLVFSSGEDSIRESIWLILSTARGERMMRPEFGCGIHDLVFASINVGTMGLIKANVQESLTFFEPRIDVINVDVSDKEATQGKLLIIIDYQIRITNNEFNLVFPFYLKEGSEQ
jgi:phage baseplate assembly protein W